MTFAAELRRAMTANGVSQRQLARILGCSPHLVFNAVRPDWRPNHPYAVRMAEVLTWPKLAELSVKANTRECGYCHGSFLSVRPHGKERRFCSKGCQNRAACRRRRSSERALRERTRKLIDNRLTLHQKAVAEFCRSCEWDGLCKTPECPLRAISPLPLARVRAA